MEALRLSEQQKKLLAYYLRLANKPLWSEQSQNIITGQAGNKSAGEIITMQFRVEVSQRSAESLNPDGDFKGDSKIPHLIADNADMCRIGEILLGKEFRKLRNSCRVQDFIIQESRVKVHGCGYTIAISSFLVEWAKGKTIEELKHFEVQQLIDYFAIPKNKLHVVILIENLLGNLLN